MTRSSSLRAPAGRSRLACGSSLGSPARPLRLLLLLVLPGCGAAPRAAPAAPESSRWQAAEADAGELPVHVELAMRQVPIAMFMTTWCPVCVRARTWLKRHGYRFVELDVERDPFANSFHRALSPRGSVPLFHIDGMVVVGFDPQLLRLVLLRAVRARSRADPTALRSDP